MSSSHKRKSGCESEAEAVSLDADATMMKKIKVDDEAKHISQQSDIKMMEMTMACHGMDDVKTKADTKRIKPESLEFLTIDPETSESNHDLERLNLTDEEALKQARELLDILLSDHATPRIVKRLFYLCKHRSPTVVELEGQECAEWCRLHPGFAPLSIDDPVIREAFYMTHDSVIREAFYMTHVCIFSLSRHATDHLALLVVLLISSRINRSILVDALQISGGSGTVDVSITRPRIPMHLAVSTPRIGMESVTLVVFCQRSRMDT